MKYKNISSKMMFFNIEGKWVDLQPGATIKMSERNMDKRYKGLKIVEESNSIKDEVIIEATYMNENILKSMTKDELNDYAAKIGFEKLTSRINKKSMIKKILDFIGGK